MKHRPLLYTDTIAGKQVCRDDMWVLTTVELTSLQAENKRLEDKVSGLIAGHIKIELHQKEIHAIEQKELHDRAEKAENMLIISTAAFKQECDRSHVLAVSLSDTEGAVLDLIEENDRNASKLQSIVCALEVDTSAVNLEASQLKLIVDTVVRQSKLDGKEIEELSKYRHNEALNVTILKSFITDELGVESDLLPMLLPSGPDYEGRSEKCTIEGIGTITVHDIPEEHKGLGFMARCDYCKEVHDQRVACPEYAASINGTEEIMTATKVKELQNNYGDTRLCSKCFSIKCECPPVKLAPGEPDGRD